MMTTTDRNKFHFVTICCCSLSLLAALAAPAVDGLAIAQQNRYDDNDILGPQQQQQQQHQLQSQQQETTAHPNVAFSPRLDYNNEWRPVGRGDPLKNDPTYDYSPPALERVRYWAENSDKDNGQEQSKKKEHGPEVLLLGAPSGERVRGAKPPQSLAAKNAKGETPLLQPKYSSVRRSYYAHQLPTRLMPPPMQTVAPSSHMNMKSAIGDYRHTASSTTMGMSSMSSAHSKPYYSTAATSPWLHHSGAGSTPMQMEMQHHHVQRMPHAPSAYDAHHQESLHYFSYTRPGGASASSGSSMRPESYSPNAIRPSQNVYKYGGSSAGGARKPWLHELLQKEVIKPAKPTMEATKYLMGTTKPMYAPMAAGAIGSSTTFTPISYAGHTTHAPSPPHRPSIYAHSSTPVFIAPTTPTTTTVRTTTSTSLRPVFTTPSTTSSRLLIPNTSNLAHRPTVAPMEMTTDSLFSHYNQPEKPLLGPMYLIIEGHSKVKTYGKNEFDPHQPKIVPIISRREPVVRIADPNEKRGTIETFQVKHLHTKTTPTIITTTTTRTTTTTQMATKKPAVTPRPEAPSASPATVKLSNGLDEPAAMPPTGMQGLFSLLDIFADEPAAFASNEQQQLQEAGKQPKIYVTTVAPNTTILKPVTPPTTRPSLQQPQLEPRVSSEVGTIAAEGREETDKEVGLKFATTEAALRDTRQVFDYDQRPEARIKPPETTSDNDIQNDGEAEGIWLGSAYNEDEDADMENEADYGDDSQQLLRRIDHLVDSNDDEEGYMAEEAEGDEMTASADLEEDETEDFVLGRATKAVRN